MTGGRGAWPADGRGGTLERGNPGRYYELAPVGVTLVGSRPGASPDHQAVTFGVLALQKACNFHGWRDEREYRLVEDGVYGGHSCAAIVGAQHTMFTGTGVRYTPGRVDAATALMLFGPIYQMIESRYRLPAGVVAGGAKTESGHDPGAIGAANEHDHGLVQINSDYHGPGTPSGLSIADMHDPIIAIDFLGSWYRRSYDLLGRWDAAVASWHNPAQAREWAATGNPPNPALAAYAASVLAGG